MFGIAALAGIFSSVSFAADCNANAIDDSAEIEAEPSLDCNANGELDSCELTAPEIRFDGPRCLSFADTLLGIAVTDVDADGTPDVVAISGAEPELIVLRARGDGSYEKSSFPANVNGPLGLTARDLDDDGAVDIVVANDLRDTVSVFWGMGDGSFLPGAEFPTGENPSAIAVDDVNNDGRLDLITGNQIAGSISILLGRAERDFHTHLDTEAGSQPLALATGDFDRDGELDVAVGNRGVSGIAILLGKGDGTFSAGPRIGSVTWPIELLAEDLDQDGWLDLVTAGFDTHDVRVHLGIGGGQFGRSWQFALGGAPSAEVLEDIDQDGALDILVFFGDGYLSVLRGSGDGTFVKSEGLGGLGSLSALRGFAVTDFDGDGSFDLVAGNRDGVVIAAENDGFFGLPRVIATNEAPKAIVTGDFDGGDGAGLDEVAVLESETGDVHLWRIDAGGELREGPLVFTLPRAQDLAAVYADRDGDLDLVVLGNAEATVLLNEGDGAFVAGSTLQFERAVSTAWTDIDGDGTTDLVRLVVPDGSSPPTIEAFLGEGDGSYRSAVESALSRRYESIAAGDLDGDQVPDLAAVARDPDAIKILRGLGNGVFVPSRELQIPFSSGVVVPGLADIDADGKLDIVLGTFDGTVVWRGHGGGLFSEAVLSQSEIETNLLLIEDLDLDGFPELVGSGASGARWLPGSPEGAFGEAQCTTFLGSAVLKVTFGRFDGDALPDIVAVQAPFAEGAPHGLIFARNTTEISSSRDCNRNGRPDTCDIDSGASTDLDADLVPDECQPDCDGNHRPDSLDIALGDADDIDGNGIPDTCESDCNGNGLPDAAEIRSGASRDVDGNRIPDECQIDCNANGVPDRYEVISGSTADLDENGIPDACQDDCDGSGVLDSYEIQIHAHFDRNANGLPDLCDVASGQSTDVDGNTIPDEIEIDCNGNGYPDRSEIRGGSAPDRNRNGVPDECDIATGTSADVDEDGVPDESEPDCNRDGIPDDFELASGSAEDCDGDGLPDECELAAPVLPFGADESIATPRGMDSATLADLDGDGNLDFIGLSNRRDGFAVLRGDGWGGFEASGQYELDGTFEIVARDIDRDGNLDVVAPLRNAGQFAVWVGTGDGTFGDPRLFPAQATSRSVADLVVADANGDGVLDVVLALEGGENIRIFGGLGNGEFSESTTIDLRFAPRAITAGDVDHDGRADIVVASTNRSQNKVFLADGAGGFSDAGRWAEEDIFRLVEVRDFDGDGLADVLAIPRTAADAQIYPGRGDGSFAEPFALGFSAPLHFVERTDFDLDGTDDFLGIVENWVEIRYGPAAEMARAVQRFPFEFRPGAATAGDVDRDGVPDLVAPEPVRGALWIKRSGVPGGLEIPNRFPVGVGSGISYAGDFDGDGALDIALLRPGREVGQIAIAWGDGSGGFRPGPLVELAFETGRADVADVDGDGWADLVISSSWPEGDAVILSVAAGRELEPLLEIPFPSAQKTVIVRDLDLDGDPDLAGAYGNGFALRMGLGGGELGAPVISFTDSLETLETGDFDEDGSIDIVGLTQNSNTFLDFFAGNGDGTFTRVSHRPTGMKDAEDLIVRDADGDGHLDLLVASDEEDELGFFRGDGSGEFTLALRTPVLLSSSWGSRSLVSADWDGDGRNDLLTTRGECLVGDGDGTYSTAAFVSVGAPISGGTVADIDGDRDDDVVFGVTDSTELVVVRNDARHRETDCDDSGVLDSCEALEDCNQNGVPDACELANGMAADVDRNGVIDSCQEDCNGNGLPDGFELARATAPDCNENDIIDTCEPPVGELEDTDGNGLADACEGRCMIPGDCNVDFRLEISDAICLLGYLFLGNPAGLPCGDGNAKDAANIALLDFQGDGKVDVSDPVAELRFLFLGGPPHPLAVTGEEKSACVRIFGCR